jgi:hypothetical protein
MASMEFRRRWRWFMEHCGYCTPPGRVVCAAELARAEALLWESDCEVEWRQDWDSYPDDYGVSYARRRNSRAGYWGINGYARHGEVWSYPMKRRNRRKLARFRGRWAGQEWGWVKDSVEVEAALLVDGAGRVLASLWGIVDADSDYRRLVAAELAHEAADAIRASMESDDLAVAS